MSGYQGGEGEPPIAQSELIDILHDRFRPAPALPSTQPFNPSGAPPQVLMSLGVPPRPDPDFQPLLYRRWMTTFNREFNFVPFKFSGNLIADANFHPFFRRTSFGPTAALVSGGRYGGSKNWSGAYVEPNGGRLFYQVWGRFIVPIVVPPAGAAPPVAGQKTEYQCATWVGFDGQRRYRDSSLPQVGTVQAVVVDSGGTETRATNAWVQWWAREDDGLVSPIGPVIISNIDFPVDPLDDITCIATVVDSLHVEFVIINMTTNPPNIISITGKAPTANNGTYQYTVVGATAEWVMERPMKVKSTDLWPFPDYGSMAFTDCFAVEMAGGTSAFAIQDLTGPRFIRMYEIRHNPERTAYISMSDRIDDTSFGVAYNP